MTKNQQKKKIHPNLLTNTSRNQKKKEAMFIARKPKAQKKGGGERERERGELDETHVQVHISIFVN